MVNGSGRLISIGVRDKVSCTDTEVSTTHFVYSNRYDSR